MTMFHVVKYGRSSADTAWHREVVIPEPRHERESAQHIADAYEEASEASGNHGYVRFEVEEI